MPVRASRQLISAPFHWSAWFGVRAPARKGQSDQHEHGANERANHAPVSKILVPFLVSLLAGDDKVIVVRALTTGNLRAELADGGLVRGNSILVGLQMDVGRFQ